LLQDHAGAVTNLSVLVTLHALRRDKPFAR
jgi:hypothetical protein